MSNGGKRDGLDKGICVTVLADRPGDREIPFNHMSVPYPRNLTLVKQFARSIVVGREPPLVLAVYILNVVSIARESAQRLKQQLKTWILKIQTYQILLQSVI